MFGEDIGEPPKGELSAAASEFGRGKRPRSSISLKERGEEEEEDEDEGEEGEQGEEEEDSDDSEDGAAAAAIVVKRGKKGGKSKNYVVAKKTPFRFSKVKHKTVSRELRVFYAAPPPPLSTSSSPPPTPPFLSLSAHPTRAPPGRVA